MIEQTDGAEDSDTNSDRVVLQVDGEGAAPFIMRGKMNKRDFSAMIDSGSPISIFTVKDLKSILGNQLLFAKPMPKSEMYVDYNKRPLDLLGYIHVHIKVGQKEIKRARVVIARTGRD